MTLFCAGLVAGAIIWSLVLSAFLGLTPWQVAWRALKEGRD